MTLTHNSDVRDHQPFQGLKYLTNVFYMYKDISESNKVGFSVIPNNDIRSSGREKLVVGNMTFLFRFQGCSRWLEAYGR